MKAGREQVKPPKARGQAGQFDDALGPLLDFSQKAGQNFANGDFNYDGIVNVTDFTILAGNFNVSLSGAQQGRSSVLPAPARSPFGQRSIGSSKMEDANNLAALLA